MPAAHEWSVSAVYPIKVYDTEFGLGDAYFGDGESSSEDGGEDRSACSEETGSEFLLLCWCGCGSLTTTRPKRKSSTAGMIHGAMNDGLYTRRRISGWCCRFSACENAGSRLLGDIAALTFGLTTTSGNRYESKGVRGRRDVLRGMKNVENEDLLVYT